MFALEALLRYFHVTCEPEVKSFAKDLSARALFFANVDCVAAEAFFSAKTGEHKAKMLEATAKYYWQLKRHVEASGTAWTVDEGGRRCPDQQWMQYPDDDEVPELKLKGKAAVADKPEELKPRVLQFDKGTGRLLNSQDSREISTDRTEGKVIEVPWRDWMESKTSMSMTTQESGMAQALSVLSMLHHANVTLKQHVNVILTGGKLTVVATEDILAQQMNLPPCVPRSCKVHKDSTHPMRARMTVRMKSVEGGTVCRDAPEAHNYFVNPEWKLPVEGDEGLWEFQGEETLHPFWAVRRLSIQQQRKEKIQAVNCEITHKAYTAVIVGEDGDASTVSYSYEVGVPFITNSIDIKSGQELILEIAEKAITKRVEFWKTDTLKASKKQKTKPKKEDTTEKTTKQKTDIEI